MARLQRPAVASPRVSKEGPLAAALLASGIGSAALGLFSLLTAALAPLRDALSHYSSVGPLSGLTLIPMALWVAAWAVLHTKWRDKEKNFSIIFAVTMLLVLVGLAGTFPPVYELVAQ